MYETLGSHNSTRIDFCVSFKTIYMTNMLEDEKMLLATQVTTLRLFFKPFEIITLLLVL